MEQGRTLVWSWDMYGVSVELKVRRLEPNRKRLIDWPTLVEWTFDPRGDGTTMVTITASGLAGTDEEQMAKALDAPGGFSYALAGCKAFLEHGIRLNLVQDHAPDAHVAADPDLRIDPR